LTYIDVPPSHTNYETIDYVTARGWLGGYGDGSFRPQNSLWRAQFARVAASITCPVLTVYESNWAALRRPITSKFGPVDERLGGAETPFIGDEEAGEPKLPLVSEWRARRPKVLER
jgi:hypothetical protein